MAEAEQPNGNQINENAQEEKTPTVADIFWKHEGDEVWHFRKSEDDINCFHRIDAKKIPLRGKNYLTDKKKYPSKDSAFELVCCKCFKTKQQMLHAGKEVDSLCKFLSDNEENEYFIVNWLVPGHYTCVNLYVRTLKVGEDAEFDNIYTKFREGDSKFRSDRFKYIPELLEAPSMVKSTVNAMLGGLRPVLIGNKLTCHHFTGKNYVEVDVDTGSSRIVSAAAGILVKGFAGIVANTGFLIEGRDESELPERMLGYHCNTKISLATISLQYDYDPPPPQSKKKKSWFGGMFGGRSSRTSSKANLRDSNSKSPAKSTSTLKSPSEMSPKKSPKKMESKSQMVSK